MKPYRVTLRPAAFADLQSIEAYIAEESSPEVAEGFVQAIAQRCFALDHFPLRGTPRDDLRPGARTIPFRRSVTILYAVEEREVAVLGIFYGGRDLEGLMADRGS